MTDIPKLLYSSLHRRVSKKVVYQEGQLHEEQAEKVNLFKVIQKASDRARSRTVVS